MTDEQIIKALECCGEIDRIFCDSCTYKNENDCVVALARDAIDLINRQKAEIERWKEQNVRINKECDHLIRFASTAKAEALREFAERLRTKRGSHGEIWGEDIDNLVKEMTEE